MVIDVNIYQGVNKLNSYEKNFMTSEKILEAVKEIKIENSEGHDAGWT